MSKEEILIEIDALEKKLDNFVVHDTEIYSRVVGYYRPVNQWNAGKREEWKVRAKFDSAIPVIDKKVI